MANKWDNRFLDLAEHIAQWSKDPSTKVGAVLVSPDRIHVVHGYNGFPRGVLDTEAMYENKEAKYKRVVHAELNAILNSPIRPSGWTIYVSPLPPCTECTKAIIQSGITEVVWCLAEGSEVSNKWLDEWEIALGMLQQRGVKVRMVKSGRVRHAGQGSKALEGTARNCCGKSCSTRNS